MFSNVDPPGGRENPGRQLPRGGEASKAVWRGQQVEECDSRGACLWGRSSGLTRSGSPWRKKVLTPPERVTSFVNDFEVLLRKLRLRETSVFLSFFSN